MLKNKNYVKLFLDVMIAIAFTLLFNARVLGGLPFHEIAGLGIGVGFLTHILLNSQWVKIVTLRLFDRKLPGKIRFGYFLNILLLIMMIMIIVSGLMISKLVFPGSHAVDQRWFHVLHLSVSYLALIIVGMHVGLHWQWILGMLKKVFKVQSISLMRVLARVTLILVIFFGGFQILDTQVTPQIAQLGTTAITNSRQISPEGFEGKEFNRENRGATPDGKIGDPGVGSSVDESKAKFGRQSSAGVILMFSGIIGFFAFITYSVEKLLTKRKIRH